MMTQTLTLIMLLITFVVIGACITNNPRQKKLVAYMSLLYIMPTLVSMIVLGVVCMVLVIVYAIASTIVDGIYKVLDLFKRPSAT